MSEYGQMMARVKRESELEASVRAKDAADIVEDMLKLEDEILELEASAEESAAELTALRAVNAELRESLMQAKSVFVALDLSSTAAALSRANGGDDE